MIRIEYKDDGLAARFDKLARMGRDLRPAMRDIGEYLVRSTKKRFAAGKGPDGAVWKPNTAATLAGFLRRRAGGTVRRKGETIKKKTGLSGKKPLIGESKRLSSEIHYRDTPTSVEIGSSLEYSATQQFGAMVGAFGRTRKGAPIPWGNIPPRPFLGLSASDRENILGIIEGHIQQALRG